MREVNSYGPAFALACHDNGIVKLSRVTDRSDYTVIIFFLVASSPGCTLEMKGFVDLWPEFQKRKVGIIGISPDNIPALAQFAKEINSPFDLCSDMDHRIAEEWGAWSERGQMRSTFLLNDKGVIAYVWPRANVYNHAADVLRVICEKIIEDGGEEEMPNLPQSTAAAPGQLPMNPSAPAAPAAAAAPAAPAPPAAAVMGHPGAPHAAHAPHAPHTPYVPGAPLAYPGAVPHPPYPAPPGYPPGYPGAPMAHAGYPMAPHPGQYVPAPAALGAADVVFAFARTSLQLLAQHVETGGQLPPDLADLAARIAWSRYAQPPR